MNGVDTAAVASYTVGPIQRSDVQDFIPKVVVETDTALTNMQTNVAVLADGSVHEASHDVNRPSTDLDAQGAKLRVKFDALATPVLGAARSADLGDALAAVVSRGDVAEILDLAR